MSEDMIETVARAIFRARIAQGGPGSTMMVWPLCPEAAWCRDTARAAISAMREPPKRVIDGCYDRLMELSVGNPEGEPEIVWRAMIDAALKEPA